MVHENVADSGINIDIDLRRHDLTSGIVTAVFSTPSSTDSTEIQTINDTTTSNGTVDNSRYAYFLWVDMGSGSPSGLTVYGCSVSYN